MIPQEAYVYSLKILYMHAYDAMQDPPNINIVIIYYKYYNIKNI